MTRRKTGMTTSVVKKTLKMMTLFAKMMTFDDSTFSKTLISLARNKGPKMSSFVVILDRSFQLTDFSVSVHQREPRTKVFRAVGVVFQDHPLGKP